MRKFQIMSVSMLIVAAAVGTSPAAIGDAEKCVAAKIKIVSKYESCRFKAESLAVLKEVSPDNTKCEAKYVEGWQKTELKYGLDCPTDGDQGSINNDANTHVNLIVATLKNVAPSCGNNTIDAGETCDGTALNSESCVTQGYDDGTLACMPNCGGFDTSDCAYHECSLLDQTGCGGGQGCYPLGQSEVCAPAGAGTSGTGCMFANSCTPGLACVNYGMGPKCTPMCDNIDAIPGCGVGETCVNMPDWDTNVGYCEP
jgi:hypothetical protein